MDFVGEPMHINKLFKNVCIFLVFVILLFGMCFDTVQTDSFLSYTLSEKVADNPKSSPTLESPYHTSFLNQLCSDIILGRSISAVIQKQTLKKDFRIRIGKGHSFAYLFLSILSLFFAFSLTWKAYVFMPDIRKSSIIIRYIQLTEGMKPTC